MRSCVFYWLKLNNHFQSYLKSKTLRTLSVSLSAHQHLAKEGQYGLYHGIAVRPLLNRNNSIRVRGLTAGQTFSIQEGI